MGLKIILLLGLGWLSFNIQAQQFPLALKKLNTEYRQEKLYIHFDRTFYSPGETIWFKAYLFAGNFPSLISKTLYTELIDEKGKLLQQVLSPVILSSAAGSLEIPPGVGGRIYVRAYTKWMLNFDSSFLYTKEISISIPGQTVNNNRSAAKAKAALLHFFPEGGDLVEETESRVAFKATDEKGFPVEIKGEIVDENRSKITSFESRHDGMGVFLLQPKKGQRYRAVWRQQGEPYEAALPDSKQNGIVLAADNTGNEIHFTIKHSATDPAYPFVYVTAQMHQQLFYRGKATIDKDLTPTGTIPLGNVPAGIVQITVFSPEEEPLAERLVFARASPYSFTPLLNISLKDTGRRGKNTIEIEVPDTLSYNLSLAVTDAGLDPGGEKEENIYSGLLLTSDIKGYVHNPAWYFSSDADSVTQQLDLVMMTNGWRRFKWKNILAGQFPDLKYLPGDYISVEGQVQGLKNKSLEGQEINGVMEYKNKGKEFINIPLQPDGRFSIPGMVFYDTAKLFYQFNKDKKKTLTDKARFTIKTDLLSRPLFLSPDPSSFPSPLQPDTPTLRRLVYRQRLWDENVKNIKMLKPVTVTGKQKSKKDLIDEEYTSGAFSDPSSQTRIILPEDDPAFLSSQSLLYYLRGRAAGLSINPDSKSNAVTWRGQITSLFVNEIPQEFVSTKGQITQDDSYILSLPMSDIAMVKIFDPPFFGAWGGGPGGAIAVYLKKPGDRGQPVNNDFSALRGYTLVKEFYSPDYSQPAGSDLGDYRSTLYWNPYLIFDKDHRTISLSFYNNDITKTLKITIEGCDENGKLTRVERIIH